MRAPQTEVATPFTGKYPHVHGVVDDDMPLARSHVGLPELLRRRGYTTAITGKLISSTADGTGSTTSG